MHIPMPLVAAAAVAAVAFLLLIWLSLRGRDRRRDLMGPPVFPPHVHPPPPDTPSASQTGLLSLSPEMEAEIRELVRQRRKIEAIKRLRELRPMSLKDAKDHVERM